MAGNFMEFLNRFINDWAKYNGVNFIYGQYAEQGVVIKGIMMLTLESPSLYSKD